MPRSGCAARWRRTRGGRNAPACGRGFSWPARSAMPAAPPRPGGSCEDPVQEWLQRRMLALTAGDLARPVVVASWNADSTSGHNLVLRLLRLGHTDMRWYRDGKETWEARGLPETLGQAEDP